MTGIKEPKSQKRKSSEENEEEDAGENATDGENETEEDSGKMYPGIAVWVAFNAPMCHIQDIENTIIQVVQSSGLSPVSCKVSFKLTSIISIPIPIIILFYNLLLYCIFIIIIIITIINIALHYLEIFPHFWNS